MVVEAANPNILGAHGEQMVRCPEKPCPKELLVKPPDLCHNGDVVGGKALPLVNSAHLMLVLASYVFRHRL